MEKFYCKNCQKIFEARGEKKEWESSIFGRQWKLVAKCSDCDVECEEYRTKTSGKSSCTNTCSICSLCK
jgi:hypothetical protein